MREIVKQQFLDNIDKLKKYKLRSTIYGLLFDNLILHKLQKVMQITNMEVLSLS